MRKVPKPPKKGYAQQVRSQIHTDWDIKKIFFARAIEPSWVCSNGSSGSAHWGYDYENRVFRLKKT